MKALLESQKQSASKERAPEDDVIRSQFFQRQIHQKPRFFQKLKSVDKVLCTKSTTTMSTLVPATTNSAQCLLYTKRITAIKAETFPYLLEWI